MRLTLRSLLAYLDGLLPGDDQQDLAARVGGSAVAQTLVAQIRRVIAQPGIGAPRPDGRGLGDDANSVAEYLDNSLPPERLGPFERICIESDAHLAEVASCHAILATAIREPALVQDLDANGRRRLLKAVQHRMAELAAESERKEALANAEVVRSAAQVAVPESETTFAPFAARPTAAAGDGPAVARRQRPAWVAWASAGVALLLLVALGGVLAWSVGSRGRRVAVRPSAMPQPGAQAEQVPLAGLATEGAVEQQPAATTAPEERAGVAAAPPAEAIADKPSEGSAAEPAPAEPQTAERPVPAAASQPEPPPAGPPVEPSGAVAAAPPVASTGPSPAVPPLVPEGSALAIAAPAIPPSATPAAAPVVQPPADSPTSITAAQPAGFVGSSGLLLHCAEGGEWAACPPGSALAAREALLAPPGFHPDINVGGVTIRIFPGTQAITTADPDGTPRISVIHGRVVARASRADARLGVTAGGINGVIIAGLTAPVAVAVEFARSAGVDLAAGLARTRAELVATSGAIGWRQLPGVGGGLLEGIAGEGMLESRSALVWETTKPTRVAIERRPTEPDWVIAAPPSDAVEKRAAESLLMKVQATQPLPLALRELAADRRAENRSIAAATLALLGEYGELVEVLCADAAGRRLEAKQWAALEAQAVPLALARGEADAAKLRQAFEDHGPRGKADSLAALARGFSDEELAAGADQALVAALDDPDLVVRRYALKNLIDITRPSAADRLRYRPDGLPDLRREGVDWWRGQLQKGLVRRAAVP